MLTKSVVLSLVALAQGPDQDLPVNESSPFYDALKDAKDQQVADARKNLTVVLKQVMDSKKTQIASEVQNIRNYKRALEACKTRIKDVERMWQYAEETGNLMPILSHFGLVGYDVKSEIGYDEFDRLAKIPESWTPKA